MKKLKRIGSLICILIIVASYLTTLISVFMKNENWIDYLKASIYATVVFPILLYVIILIYKNLKNYNKKLEKEKHQNDKSEDK